MLLTFFRCTSTNIFVVLHPRHKLEYFKKAGWSTAWIEAAEAILRAEYPSSYHLRDDLAMASMVPIQVFELLYIYYSCLLIAL